MASQDGLKSTLNIEEERIKQETQSAEKTRMKHREAKGWNIENRR